ncbi:sensor histidine kinase [Paenibacillus residui]|uniref:Sensor histidine kinase n=1 Tax=Paenibacillus residui TaxID=629724 RepID=A0ABW3DGY5_9BACL
MPAKNIINRWKSSLKWKLISIFLVIVMFNLVVIGFFVNRYVAMAIEKDSIQLSRLILKQANLNLERYLGEIEQFMFTLEIINSMASQIHATDIEQMTVDLANLFRYTANYKDTKATIRDEVEHLQRYLHIIQTRYGDKFTYDLSVEETCWKAVCPKVILQPLAENAVKHGFETSGGALHLSVAIRKIEEQWIEVCFADNGMGFSEDKIRELNDKLYRQNSHYSDFQRIGLLNIHYRLTTQYTSHKAGLRIRNSDSGGAEVRFCLPMNL